MHADLDKDPSQAEITEVERYRAAGVEYMVAHETKARAKERRQQEGGDGVCRE
jgi:hypothetical protein